MCLFEGYGILCNLRCFLVLKKMYPFAFFPKEPQWDGPRGPSKWSASRHRQVRLMRSQVRQRTSRKKRQVEENRGVSSFLFNENNTMKPQDNYWSSHAFPVFDILLVDGCSFPASKLAVSVAIPSSLDSFLLYIIIWGILVQISYSSREKKTTCILILYKNIWDKIGYTV